MTDDDDYRDLLRRFDAWMSTVGTAALLAVVVAAIVVVIALL